MDPQIVHEQGDLLSLILGSHALAVLLELLDVDGLLEDLVVLQSSLLRNAAQQCQSWLLQLICVHSHVAILVRPFAVRTCLASEHGLIDVDDAEAVVPCGCQLSLHRGHLLHKDMRVFFFGLLDPSDLLLLDAVHFVHLAEQSRVHLRRRELVLELLASVMERERGLLLQRIGADDPPNLVFFQEAEAISLTSVPVQPRLHLLQQRGRLHLIFAKSL